MRCAFYSVEGGSLCWWRRLHDEGHEVLVYIDKEKGRYNQRVGDGLVPKTARLDEWLRFGAAPGAVSFFDFTGRGELADSLRRAGRLVVGGGTFMDRLEDDRPYGETFAQTCGVQAPPSYRFSTIRQAIAFLARDPQQAAGDGGWAWKPNRDLGSDASWLAPDTGKMVSWLERVALSEYGDNNACLLQERIPGVDVSTNRWWNGQAFVGPFMGTLEEKKLMNDNVGASTGCSLNMVWFYPAYPRVAQEQHWTMVEAEFRKAHAPPGLYDINAILNREGSWFLEWTPRLGFDSEITSQRAISDLGGFIYALATGTDVTAFFDPGQLYVGVRLSVPPYPVADRDLKESASRRYAKHLAILGGVDGLWDKHFVATGVARGPDGLIVVAQDGYVGVAVAAGSSLTACCEDIYAYLDGLCIPNLQYRTDAAKNIQEDIDEMGKMGWETTPLIDAADDEEAA